MIPDTLSNYGPWGYLMLGMLVCGAFLMLCGLWECCCRQPKATASASHPSHPPTTVLMPQVSFSAGRTPTPRVSGSPEDPFPLCRIVCVYK